MVYGRDTPKPVTLSRPLTCETRYTYIARLVAIDKCLESESLGLSLCDESGRIMIQRCTKTKKKLIMPNIPEQQERTCVNANKKVMLFKLLLDGQSQWFLL